MTIEELVAQYHVAASALATFMSNEAVAAFVHEYKQLTAAIDAVVDEIKKAYRGMPDGTEQILSGVYLRRSASRTYDVEKLKAVPGISDIKGLFYEALDSKRLDTLVKAGILSKKEIDACKTVEASVTVTVKPAEKPDA